MKSLTKKNYSKGFTLIEMMTSLTIFAVIMTISMGAILGVFDANRKSESLKTVLDNMNFAVETMNREMRFGSKYHCGATGTITSPQDCSAADTYVSFLSSDAKQTVYKLNGTAIQKSTDGGVSFIDVTAPEISITGLSFYVKGSGTGDGFQPRILLRVSGYAGAKTNTRTAFTLQSMITQRARDI